MHKLKPWATLSALLAILLLFNACNIREDLLLPPNLSAADYLTGNKIEAYANYLVKSSNDNSYLLINKTAIADSLLNYGDTIVFRKVQNLASRDSLGMQTGAIAQSSSYIFSVLRSGVVVDFVSETPLGTIYTDLSSNSSSLYLVNFAYYLQASALEPVFYGNKRGYFPLSATGEFAVFSIPDIDVPQLQHDGTEAFYALLVNSESQLAVNFPASYCNAAGQITLSLGESLSTSDQNNLQGFFPNSAISTPIIELQTASSTGSQVAPLRLISNSKRYFEQLWTQLSPAHTYTWQANDATNGTANWWQEGSNLYSFVFTGGKYFLISPLNYQNEISLPLDGSLSQVLLQDLWFDLNGISLPNTTMKVKLSNDPIKLIMTYFNGNPYTLSSGYRNFDISFWEGETQLKTLPNEAFIEFGFNCTMAATGNDRLFTIYRDEQEDILTYKTPAASYDATHYSRNDNNLYAGISNSATYFFGSITDSSNQTIPYFKSKLYLQTSYSTISWDDSTKRSFSQLNLDHAAAVPNHPWLQGEPLLISNTHGLANFTFMSKGSPVNTLPANFYLSLPVETVPENLLLFDNTNYPRLKHYLPAATFTGDSFVAVGASIIVYPEFPGKIISTSLSYPNPLSLRVYPTMTFVIGELRLYTYGAAPAGQSALFSITRSNTLADPFQILSSQYTLAQASSAYTISTSAEANYGIFEPTLFFKRSTRNQNLLFYENTGDYYRLYSYSQSETFDPWAFMIDGGYNGISLSYNGSYASFTDTNVHSFVSSSITNATLDAVLSLYQAQFVLPNFFIGTTVPLGSTLRMDKQSSMPGISNLLAAYQLQLTRANGIPLNPSFNTIVGATQEPYIYIPVSNIDAIPNARFFYRDTIGQTTELTRVTAFSTNFASEYTVIGNCFICTVNNGGIFYVTGQ